MRKKPFSTISVLGSKTKVFISEIPEHEKAIAQYIPSEDLILLDKSDDQLWKSFCHELFHLLVNRSGIRQSNISHDVEEILAENFSVLMDENLTDMLKIKRKLSKK